MDHGPDGSPSIYATVQGTSIQFYVSKLLFQFILIIINVLLFGLVTIFFPVGVYFSYFIFLTRNCCLNSFLNFDYRYGGCGFFCSRGFDPMTPSHIYATFPPVYATEPPQIIWHSTAQFMIPYKSRSLKTFKQFWNCPPPPHKVDLKTPLFKTHLY